MLVVPGQDLPPERFVKAARLFGTAMRQALESFAVPAHPEINVVSSEDKDATAGGKPFIRGVTWHTDHSFSPIPPKGTILYGIDIPSSGGDTQYLQHARRLRDAARGIPSSGLTA